MAIPRVGDVTYFVQVFTSVVRAGYAVSVIEVHSSLYE